MSHPVPELLVPYALGAEDPATGLHVDACGTCRTEVERLQEAAGLLRAPVLFERRSDTADCLDELVVADFVEGRLASDARRPVVAHLLACARCRSLVKTTSHLAADTTLAAQAPARRWRRWALPLGAAAAAGLLLMLFPLRSDDGSTPELREPPLTRTVAPVPITPRASVTRLDRLLWSSVPHAERYRLRLYDDQGTVVWRAETTDTFALLPRSVTLSGRVSYFWRVEAQTEWGRWAASELVEFRLAAPSPR